MYHSIKKKNEVLEYEHVYLPSNLISLLYLMPGQDMKNECFPNDSISNVLLHSSHQHGTVQNTCVASPSCLHLNVEI